MNNNTDVIYNGDDKFIVDENDEPLMLHKGDRIIRAKSIDRLKKEETEHPSFKIDAKFIKLFTENIIPIFKQLQDGNGKIKYSAVSLMFYLMQFISYRDGLLQHKNGRPITNSDIIKNFNMGKNEIYANLKLLRKNNIIATTKVKDKTYYIFNPFIACNGSKIDNTTRHIFDENMYKLNWKENSDTDK